MLNAADKIFANLQICGDVDIQGSIARGDWGQIEDILSRGAGWIIEQVKKSGLRGRGGAGFSTGAKWSFVAQDGAQHYMIINADESEPGTCKDRDILRYEPHKIIEGALIASHAIGANVCYIYIRGEYYLEAQILQRAIDEAYIAGFLGNDIAGMSVDIFLHSGAGAYICGEESALLESLEGKKGMPRLKPPFPAAIGLYGCPTVINNVETIAVVGTILRRGADWFASIGKPNNTGTKIFSISGHVNNPCNVEEAMGVPLRELIERYAGGVIGGWENLKAIIPGGSSTPMITKDIAQSITMDFDALQQVGSALGTGGIIVMDNSVDLVRAVAILSKFYMHESCGQCSPCREGVGWLWRMMNKIADCNATVDEVDRLLNVTKQIQGHTICALGDAAAWPIQGLMRHFGDQIKSRLNK